MWALRRRPDNIVDRWDGSTYRRALLVGGRAVEVAVRQTGPPDEPQLRVDVTGTRPGHRSSRTEVCAKLKCILSVGVDLAGFFQMAQVDPLLGPLAERFRGLHPPRLPGLFETLVNAVSCQQLSITVGIVLLNRLAETYGRAGPGASSRTFPDPDDLAGAAPEALRKLGYSRRKSEVLVGLARSVVDGEVDLDDLVHADDATAISGLCELNGIGRWSAEYVLLRGLGRLHVFPGDDVGARNKLASWLGLTAPPDYGGVGRVVDRWQPYAGLVYFHLLLDSLTSAGQLLASGSVPLAHNRR
jgi:DNA-3-methyladenine glycosylase II